MPELPEVETMVRGLRPAMEGHTIASVTVHDPFLLQGATSEEFERRVGGSSVLRVGRRGKWVVIETVGDRGTIVIQPRMTGGFWLVSPKRPEHIRVTFEMRQPGGSVWFCDARRLGKVAWFADEAAAEAAFSRSHGPDALEIAAAELASRLSRTTRGIKPTLMDQKILAGIGNIYADEVLFRSRLHPERPASGLSKAEVVRLHRAIGEILARAIEVEGTSFDTNYRTPGGGKGLFLAEIAVYGQGGRPCPFCSGPILKTKIAGLKERPTHYCPKCQVMKPARSGNRGRG